VFSVLCFQKLENNKMKKQTNSIRLTAFFLAILFSSLANAQLLSFGSDAVTIKSGTTVVVENLSLIPSADITISNNTLDKFTTIINPSINPYISRVYRFSNSTPLFNGSVQVNYNDAELNGIPENQLTLNINNGSLWNAFPATLRDGINNFVLTNNVSSVLNELTLANASTPLPLTWLSFTATRQNQIASLNWATAQEQNTRNFIVEHSAHGISWNPIGTLPAAGFSTGINHYNFTHTSPLTGMNYYRILQTDIDNRYSYSSIQALEFNGNNEPFTLTGNIVTNHSLTLQVNIAGILALYNADGKLLWQETVNTGTKTLSLSQYAKGLYLLKSQNTTQKLVIQ
jgi:hypothetical protein